jgi:DNA repair protein RadC
MPLTHLPPDARPREKLLARGPQALADAELLALLLRTGVQGTPVLQLAQGLLDRFGGWAGLLAASVQDLGKVKGLGPAKRAEIAAVLEIARRSLNQQLAEKSTMNDVDAVKAFVRLHLGSLGHEVFAVLFLDAQLRLLVHNHPSGVAEPSHADELLTRQLSQALALVDVRVVDHLVVGAGDVVSFAERGLM